MNKAVLSIAAVMTLALSGCASILNQPTQKINVSASNGKEIQGSIDGQAFKAPGVIDVRRENRAKILTVSTEGCAKETAMEKNVDPKFFINILTGGLVGSSTDYATERMWTYSDNVVVACK